MRARGIKCFINLLCMLRYQQKMHLIYSSTIKERSISILNQWSIVAFHNSYYIYTTAMIKEEVIYEEQSEIYQRRSTGNTFVLTDQQKNNIAKRLPRGFSLAKVNQFPKNTTFRGEIEYVPTKRQPRIASQDLNKQFLAQPIIPTQPQFKDLGKNQVGVDKAGLRFSQLPQGKSKQGEKIKNILQRFRRHYRYPQLSSYLQRMGFMSSFLQIESQNKKNIHTIDSFKDRMMFVFKHLKDITFEETALSMINELVDQFLFHVEQARKLEFENSLNNIQKSIDKVTREISEIKQSGNYYYRKKKRNEKNYDQKEILYVAELIRALPQKEWVGILQIIQQKPFQEISTSTLNFNLAQLKPKKIRQIQFYVKKKLSNYHKSRQRKRDKIMKRRKANQKENEAINLAQAKSVPQEPRSARFQREESIEQPMKQQAKNEAEINYIFEFDQQPKNEEPAPRERSLFSYDDRSRNQFDDFLQDRPSDLFFGLEADRSIKNPSIMDRNEKVQQENIQFEQANLFSFENDVKQQRQQQGQEMGEYDSSDSSYITDQQDSDY